MTTNKPKERPILFNAEMVRAILDGRKTQTRWIVNPQPELSERAGFVWKGYAYGLGSDNRGTQRNFARPNCPYGQPGGRLWVRETWRTGWSYGGDYPTVQYRATETAHVGSKEYPVLDVLRGEFGIPDPAPHSIVPGGKWKPSIHMPRWASRITLEITGVRVERLQDISDEDARAEGASSVSFPVTENQRSNIDRFRALWNLTHGAGAWGENPWVWVIEFKRVEP